jgi:transcriptional regulator with XRE-family HTH domain
MKQNPVIHEADIANRIKALRAENGMTLEQLAQQTGFTKGYLSKVEKSKKAPPVSTLGNIARAFNVTISSLLGEERARTSLCLVRRGERPLVARDGTAFGYSYEAMAYPYPNKMMEPFILTLPVGIKKRTFFQHEGQEILFVIQGRMRFFHGNEEYVVEQGDCIYFDSSIPHFGESIGRKEVKCFMVIYNRTISRERTSHGAK